MNARARHVMAALACAGAVAGCGSSDESKGQKLPPQVAQDLETQFAELERRVDVRIPGACDDAADENIPGIQKVVDGVPDTVDPDIRDALDRSVQRLTKLFEDECQAIKDEAQSKQDTTPETTPQDTAPQQTTPQETTPQETNTQTTPDKPKETKPKPDNGNGNDKGNGNGGATPTPSNPGGDPAPTP